MPRCEMCGEWPDCPWKTDPEIMCGEFHPKPMTNAMKIRSMTDEELAEFMNCGACPPGKDVSELCYDEDGGSVPDMCNLCWIGWLKQEVPTDG